MSIVSQGGQQQQPVYSGDETAVSGGYDFGEAGIIAPMPAAAGANVTGIASRGNYARLVPTRSFTATTIGFVVSTAASVNDSCDVGLYDAAGNRLVSSGNTAGKLNVTGWQTIAVTATALTARSIYYVGFAYSTVGGTAAVLTGTAQADFQFFFGTTFPARLYGTQAAASPLPAAIVFAASANNVPYLSVS